MNEFHFISKLLSLLQHDVREVLNPMVNGCSIYLLPMCEGFLEGEEDPYSVVNSPFQQTKAHFTKPLSSLRWLRMEKSTPHNLKLTFRRHYKTLRERTHTRRFHVHILSPP